jgi:ubiquinone/menaquinone biosynthesis C-methylase UbiE
MATIPTEVETVPGSVGLPDAEYFDVMASFARRHWWYTSRRALAGDTLTRLGGVTGVAVDVGCGTGEMLETLAGLRTAPTLVAGTDLSPHAVRFASGAASRTPILAADSEHLPLADGQVNFLTSMDVVEHLDDDLVALKEYARVVAPGGTVLLTVPAYQWMWSEHDVRACHRRRYTAARLARTAEAAGITVLRTTYYHSFLLPAAVILRKSPLRRLVRVTDEQTSYLHPAVNRIFALIARCEGWVASHVRIPFGLSIMLVGRVDRDIKAQVSCATCPVPPA